MKSKITLFLLLAVIFFLASLSFFFGYNYLRTGDKVEDLTARVNDLILTLESDNEVEKENEEKTIATFDANKVDGDAITIEELMNTVKIGNATVNRQMTGNETMGGYKGDVFIYNEKNYAFEGIKIVDAIYAPYLDGSSYYYAVLLENGAIYYSLEKYELAFKKVEITNVERIISVKAKDSNGRIMCTLGAITTDGITHLINVAD